MKKIIPYFIDKKIGMTWYGTYLDYAREWWVRSLDNHFLSLLSPARRTPPLFFAIYHQPKPSAFYSTKPFWEISLFQWNDSETKNSEVTISRNFALPPSNLGNPPGNGAQPWPLGSRCNKSLTLATIQDLLQLTSLIPGNPQDALLSLHNWSSGCWPCYPEFKAHIKL